MEPFENRRELGGLFKKYVEGKATPEEKRFVEAYYDFFDQHAEVFDWPSGSGRRTKAGQNGLDQSEREALIWKGIQDQIQANRDAAVIPLWTRWWQTPYLKVAAAVLFILSGWLYYSYQNGRGDINGVSRTRPALQLVTNTEKGKKEVVLEDGTHVVLEPGGSLYYPKSFAKDQRVVYLNGNAFFDVAKNPAKPFLVHSRDIVTRVVGTSFTIHVGRKHLEVAVLTGKVMVGKASDKTMTNAHLLTPNQKVTYYTESSRFVTGLVNQPVIIKAATKTLSANVFKFGDAPLRDVITVLEAAYGIEITVRNEPLKSCPVTADLREQSLYTKLDIVCASLKAHYDIIGTRIIITGGECQ
ncbi:FecR family protein [Larkinella insperata]|uniref:FecR family protein n=1 Tax=Larkinella insperata TaxID=332158 RepID=A0ABW3Q7X5_9BACT|nr:FecR domain-containing protein [Larkinella insperata]